MEIRGTPRPPAAACPEGSGGARRVRRVRRCLEVPMPPTPANVRRAMLPLLALVIAVVLLGAPAGAVTRRPLTNLAHLDFLGHRVDPPEQAGHTTWRLASEPEVGVLWTYAERQPDGSYRRVGGGAYDPATNTWGQGAFNADDMTRAAVVYLRHWRQFGDRASREHAYQLLRGVTYLQTASGPNAGNVVLWMQPDGTLNPSPTPTEEPDPSDSGPSYWLARTIWALGEGYAAFRGPNPAFARFLRQRLELSLDALDRQVLDPRYGTFQTVDGLRLRAWLIVDGADASSEAVYGLAAYVRAGGPARARLDLRRLANGVARMPLGYVRDWPYGALLPWARSRSLWHAWGDQMAGSLAEAGRALGREDWVRVAVGEVGRFTPRTCSPRAAPRTAGCRRPPTGSRSPTAPTPPSRTCSGPRPPPAGRPSPTWPGSPAPGSSATTRPGWPCTTRPPGGPSTASTPTGPSTATRAPSPPSTACCRCWPWTPTRRWRPGPGRGPPGPGDLAAGRGRGRHPLGRGRGHHPGLGLDGGERLERRRLCAPRPRRAGRRHRRPAGRGWLVAVPGP